MFPRGERPTAGLRGKGWGKKRIADYQTQNTVLKYGFMGSLTAAILAVVCALRVVDNYKPSTVGIAVDKTDGTVCQIGKSGSQPALPAEVTLDKVVAGQLQRCITLAREVPLRDEDAKANKDRLYNACLLGDAQTKMDEYFASSVNDRKRDPMERNDTELVEIAARSCWPISDNIDKRGTFACEWTESTQGVHHRLPPTVIRWGATVNAVIDPSMAGPGSRLSDKYDNMFGIMIENFYSVHTVN